MTAAAVRDTGWMVVRHQRNFIRQPIWLAFALTGPLFWMLLYSQLFRRIVALPGFGTDSYVQFLTPGIVVMTAFFGATWSGMAMIDDLDRGRYLRTPKPSASRSIFPAPFGLDLGRPLERFAV